jgi:hypothetical protein
VNAPGLTGRPGADYNVSSMLKGTRRAVVRRIQPISIHGQVSLDLLWTDPDDPEEEIRHARVGDEAVPKNLQPGDEVDLHYLMGMVTAVTRR